LDASRDALVDIISRRIATCVSSTQVIVPDRFGLGQNG